MIDMRTTGQKVATVIMAIVMGLIIAGLVYYQIMREIKIWTN